MTKNPTIKELCHGRLIELPRLGEASRDKRIAIMRDNLQIMREEIGLIPFFYPQSDAQVPGWIDKSDRTIRRLNVAVRGLVKLPAETLIPSPFSC